MEHPPCQPAGTQHLLGALLLAPLLVYLSLWALLVRPFAWDYLWAGIVLVAILLVTALYLSRGEADDEP